MSEFTMDEIPEAKGNYMKFEQGDNRFRILGSSIAGNQYWKEGGEKKVVIRKRKEDQIDYREVDQEKIKYFQAFPVWNYQVEKVMVLEITQLTVLKQIKLYSVNPKWGDPREYDIVVNRTGEKLKTEYTVMPEPKEALSKDAQEMWAQIRMEGFDLTKLYENGNPFGNGNAVGGEEKEEEPTPEDKENAVDDEELDRIFGK